MHICGPAAHRDAAESPDVERGLKLRRTEKWGPTHFGSSDLCLAFLIIDDYAYLIRIESVRRAGPVHTLRPGPSALSTHYTK